MRLEVYLRLGAMAQQQITARKQQGELYLASQTAVVEKLR